MPCLRPIILTWALLLLGGAQTPPPAALAPYGPFNGSFIPGGLGLKKTLGADDPLLRADAAWTIHFWVRADASSPARTLLAGFGDPAGGPDAARYLALRDGRVSFWTGGEDLTSDAPLAPGAWQFLAATFDGVKLTLYPGGAAPASRPTLLAGAAPVAHLAPHAQPLPGGEHFAGRVALFTLLPRALTAAEVRALAAEEQRFDLMAFEPGSRTWPVQTKGQDGLRVPQEAATLPQSAAPWSSPEPRPAAGNAPRLEPRGAHEWALVGGWRLIEGPKVADDGARLSRTDFTPDGWVDAVVPGTVLSTLVERGVYPDPDFGLNNFAIPESLNRQHYWYRTEFTPPAHAGRRFRLTLHGVNYAAEVWLNGRRLGDVRGAFARGTFDATGLVAPGRRNALAVRVSPPPHPGVPHEQSAKAGPGPNGGAMCLDGPTFICTEGWDWLPGVRDRATGLWQEVTLRATGAVEIGDVHVVTRLPLPDTSRAAVSISVPLGNDTGRAVPGWLDASFEGVRVTRRVVVPPGGTEVRLTPADTPELNVSRPRLWWPNGYGRPELYHLRVGFRTAAGESDVKSTRFGVREMSYELTLMDAQGRLRRVEYAPGADAGRRVVDVRHEGMIESAEGWVASFAPGGEASASVRALEDRRASPHLAVRVNGVRVAVKGGNWGLDDSRKRVTRERLEPYFRLHRHANLTMIRNWCGQNTEEVFFDLADEYGLLVWNDFWLSTQDWNLEPEDPQLFLANAREVVARFRNHPSVAVWCGRNEGVPPPLINEGLDEAVRALDGTRYYIPNSRSVNLQDSGPWNYGDAFKFFTTRARGFSTEIGLPSPPTAETLRAMMPEADLWPPSDAWAYHDWHFKGGQEVAPFLRAMEEELGAPASLEDFERKAQLLNYVSHRALFEGFNAHIWAPNTGRLMWMTHPAWPSTVWQMYASDYSTYGSFFAVKRACEPVHVQLNLPGLEAAAVNNTTRPLDALRLSARVFDASGVELSAREETVSAAAGAATEAFRVEMPKEARRGVVFVKLVLRDRGGRTLSENFYWHAAEKPAYRKLNDLPPAEVACAATLRSDGREPPRVEIELTNKGSVVALMTAVTLRRAGGRRVLPAYADDNYVSLLPGETRRLTIEAPTAGAGGDMSVTVSGWNARSATVPVNRIR
jgi:hypothetical protein